MIGVYDDRGMFEIVSRTGSYRSRMGVNGEK